MLQIIGVQFNEFGKMYSYKDYLDSTLKVGDEVVVETKSGNQLARVVKIYDDINEGVPKGMGFNELKKVICRVKNQNNATISDKLEQVRKSLLDVIENLTSEELFDLLLHSRLCYRVESLHNEYIEIFVKDSFQY